MPIVQSRRHLLTNIALAGAAGFAGLSAAGLYGARRSVATEPPPEVTTIRFEKDPVTCIAPQVFQELLHAEGFTDIRYVDETEDHLRQADAANSDAIVYMIARREVDFGRNFAPALIMGMNAGAPVTVLSGLHLGCFEVFGKKEIRSLGDLKGRAVGVDIYNSPGDTPLLTIMLSLVGLHPNRDVRWVREIHHSGRWTSSSRARSMPFLPLRPNCRKCAPGISAM